MAFPMRSVPGVDFRSICEPILNDHFAGVYDTVFRNKNAVSCKTCGGPTLKSRGGGCWYCGYPISVKADKTGISFNAAFTTDNLRFKTTERYSAGFADPRKLQTLEQILNER